MDKGSSDEKLLKLIEGAPQHKQNISTNIKKLSADSLLAKLKSSLKFIQKLRFNFLDFNKVLIGLAGLLSLWFLIKLIGFIAFSPSAVSGISDNEVSRAKMATVGQDQSTTRKTILSQEIKRNVFLPPGFKAAVLSSDAEVNLTEEIKDLKLVGIIWSDNPEVMIELGKDSRTYSLKKGDSFDNGKFKIKEITNSSATLEVSVNNKIFEYVLR